MTEHLDWPYQIVNISLRSLQHSTLSCQFLCEGEKDIAYWPFEVREITTKDKTSKGNCNDSKMSFHVSKELIIETFSCFSFEQADQTSTMSRDCPRFWWSDSGKIFILPPIFSAKTLLILILLTVRKNVPSSHEKFREMPDFHLGSLVTLQESRQNTSRLTRNGFFWSQNEA